MTRRLYVHTSGLSTCGDTDFHWRGEGGELVVVSVLDVCGDMGAAGCTSTCTPSCVVSLSVKLFFQPTQLSAVCAEWEGESDVDYGVFATESAVERLPS